MYLNWREQDGFLIVRFADASILDEARIQQIGTELMEMIAAASQVKKILLDFEGVQFMSSAMIGKLVLVNKRAKASEIELGCCNISPNVLEVFKITRLDKVFKLLGDDGPGTAGSLARLIRPPDTDGARALPEGTDGSDE